MIMKILTLTRRTSINNIYRCLSTSSAIYQNSEIVKSTEKYETIKVPEKKPQREPLIKNFSIAKVDTELLGYPEAFIDNEALKQAKLRKDSYDDFLKTNIFNVDDAKNIDKLKAFGSFNTQSTLTTESLFAASEPESNKLCYSNFISNHKLVAELIKIYCNDQVKAKYIPLMSSGELFGSVCMMEKKPPQIENKLFNTTGTKNDDSWIIDGEKSFIFLNDLNSSLLLVSAAIDSIDRIGDFEEKIGLFLIDGNSKGVSITETHPTIGYEGSPFKRVTIKFDKVEVDLSELN